ncbi:hypothetical protein COB11_02930 [Candidatus Aerophobetes bacterium]|uniref:Uncharacterized protein n=1 Tax=Aerophobetes bacterium TaxID=2030807 RepID=A0A2A4YKD1_UNCAE|nr:MAG: hypothetical protein COB11_02930 [Candidatus Aerophobetes bacterium]
MIRSKPLAVFILCSGLLFSEEFHLAEAINDTPSTNPSYPQNELIGPMVKNGCDIFISADFLYWGVKQDSLSFAQSGVSANATTPVTTRGTTKSISTSWDPGFKVALGAILPHDNWQVLFEYSWIHTKKTENAGVGFYPLWNMAGVMRNDNSTFTSDSSKATFKQTFNNLDIQLGKHLMSGTKLIIMPFMGIRGTYIDQDYDVSFVNVPANNNLLVDANLLMKADQYYWGIGLMGGMNTDWIISKHFSIFGNFLIAGLSSRFNSARKDFITPVATGVRSRLVNTRNRFYTIIPAFDFQLGFKGDMFFKDRRYHLGIQAGYEMQIFLDQNNYVILLSSSGNRGDLSFNGLSLKMRFDF